MEASLLSKKVPLTYDGQDGQALVYSFGVYCHKVDMVDLIACSIVMHIILSVTRNCKKKLKKIYI